MATYILTEDVQSATEQVLVFSAGYARGINTLAEELLDYTVAGKQSDYVLLIMAASLQEAANQVQNLKELSGEEVSHG